MTRAAWIAVAAALLLAGTSLATAVSRPRARFGFGRYWSTLPDFAIELWQVLQMRRMIALAIIE